MLELAVPFQPGAMLEVAVLAEPEAGRVLAVLACIGAVLGRHRS